jgi:hypothetical protein
MNHSILTAAMTIAFVAGCASATPTRAPTVAPTIAPAATQATTLPATAPPSPTSGPNENVTTLPGGEIDAGTYTGVYEGYRYTFTVPSAGWTSYADTGCCVVYKGEDENGAQVFLGGDMTSLYADACKSAGTAFEPGPSVDDLVSALTSLEGFESNEPTDVTLNGHSGRRVAVTVPAGVDVRSAACYLGKYSLSSNRWYQASGQTDDLWILDVDGQRLVLTFSTTPATPAELVKELEQIRDSVTIEKV